MTWLGQVTFMGEVKNVYKTSVGGAEMNFE